MYTRTKYRVLVTHPTKYHDGWFTLTVCREPNGNCHIDGVPFGCSRDYAIPKDVDAIKVFLSEHACTVVKAKVTH